MCPRGAWGPDWKGESSAPRAEGSYYCCCCCPPPLQVRGPGDSRCGRSRVSLLLRTVPGPTDGCCNCGCCCCVLLLLLLLQRGDLDEGQGHRGETQDDKLPDVHAPEGLDQRDGSSFTHGGEGWAGDRPSSQCAGASVVVGTHTRTSHTHTLTHAHTQCSVCTGAPTGSCLRRVRSASLSGGAPLRLGNLGPSSGVPGFGAGGSGDDPPLARLEEGAGVGHLPLRAPPPGRRGAGRC